MRKNGDPAPSTIFKRVVDLDEFACDLNGFLKHSPDRKIEYAESEVISNQTSQFIIRYVK